MDKFLTGAASVVIGSIMTIFGVVLIADSVEEGSAEESVPAVPQKE